MTMMQAPRRRHLSPQQGYRPDGVSRRGRLGCSGAPINSGTRPIVMRSSIEMDVILQTKEENEN